MGYWNYLSSDLYKAYHELCVAGRNDPELQGILEDSIRPFSTTNAMLKPTSNGCFLSGRNGGKVFELAMDITKFMMEGMAVSQIVGQREEKRSPDDRLPG